VRLVLQENSAQVEHSDHARSVLRIHTLVVWDRVHAQHAQEDK
jgi:hypothetical protein